MSLWLRLLRSESSWAGPRNAATASPAEFRDLDLLLFSTGTNAWNLQPQYSTNLGQTNWSALTVSSNIFANGTNELICGKPPGKAVFIRLKATLK